MDLGDLIGFTMPKQRSGPVCLAGKLLSDKKFNTFAFIDMMSKVFRPKGKLMGRDWGNGMLMFSFENGVDIDWVLKN